MSASTGQEEGGSGESQTLRASQREQVRGYLESLTTSDFIRELRHALGHAERLTGQGWHVRVAADGVEIHLEAGGEGAKTVEERAEPARVRLPPPLRAPRE